MGKSSSRWRDRGGRRAALALVFAGIGLGGVALAKVYEVQAESLKVYKGPMAYFGVQGSVEKGARLESIGDKGHWLHVRLADGSTGWILPPEEVRLPSGEVDAQYLGSTQAAAIGAGLVTKGFAQGYAAKNGVEPARFEDMAEDLDRVRFDPDTLDGFLSEGSLRPAGGAR
ncbi:MAG: SH3 domain-containing protein [Planctomycetes bacterium]|nr:SH3 domain-containing protein [Planctomycetota bacterium]